MYSQVLLGLVKRILLKRDFVYGTTPNLSEMSWKVVSNTCHLGLYPMLMWQRLEKEIIQKLEIHMLNEEQTGSMCNKCCERACQFIGDKFDKWEGLSLV